MTGTSTSSSVETFAEVSGLGPGLRVPSHVERTAGRPDTYCAGQPARTGRFGLPYWPARCHCRAWTRGLSESYAKMWVWPFGPVAETAAAPCSQQEATFPNSKNRRPQEVPIPTENEPTGSHRQSKPEQHLAGPPLGEMPQAQRLSPARMRARQLLDTALDELVRQGVKVFLTVLGLLLFWFWSR
ncbi:hypothetical protein QFZ66_005893 [Streptomyces sp. B4I13]|nr:hypothetical protein [Streptomyces sp. B4I13]